VAAASQGTPVNPEAYDYTSAARDGRLPVWDENKAYFDPATGELLPTWDEALDAIGDDDEPLHVARFGARRKASWPDRRTRTGASAT
jgi:hypothetical protein